MHLNQDLPESNSIPDTVFPQVLIFHTLRLWKILEQLSLLIFPQSLSIIVWDFGGGNSSTEKDPIIYIRSKEKGLIL